MAEMGLGYGSEFQLLRFLGHHRDELNNLIHESTECLAQFIGRILVMMTTRCVEIENLKGSSVSRQLRIIFK